MKIALSLLAVSFVSAFGQSKPESKPVADQKSPAESKYVITQHIVVPSKTAFPEDLYVIEYGLTVLKVKYAESQTSSAKARRFSRVQPSLP
jgi:hypothetical protein